MRVEDIAEAGAFERIILPYNVRAVSWFAYLLALVDLHQG